MRSSAAAAAGAALRAPGISPYLPIALCSPLAPPARFWYPGSMPDADPYVLSTISATLVPATEDEVRLQFEGFSNADLIGMGRRVGTPRLVKEIARNYGALADWLPKATADQLKLLGFVDQDWLRMAAWTGRQAEINHEAYVRGYSGGSDEKARREAEVERLRVKARQARDWLYQVLGHLSGRIPAWVQRVDQAFAASVTDEPTADSLAALAGVAEAMLADASPGMQARKAKSKLAAGDIAAQRTLAEDLAAAAKGAAAARNAPAVTQADVDLWDGLAISFFEQLVEVLDAAHDRDPAVPAPSIIALRSWFRRGRRGAGGKEDEATKPAGSAEPTKPAVPAVPAEGKKPE